MPFRFLIRLPACLADVGSAFLVFELLRRRGSLRRAFSAGLLIAANPVLFVVSGFHGNTDPVLVFFVLLSVWLLVERGLPAWAGLAMAAAFGVKLVAAIVVLVVLAAAFRRGRQTGVEFAVVCGAAVLASWLPAFVRQHDAMMRNVVGYEGGFPGTWGVTAVLRGLGQFDTIDVYAGPVRYLVLAAAVLPAAWWAWRRPADLPAAVGLAMVTFLALSPAWAPQYLAWLPAVGVLLSPVLATVYSAAAAVSLIVLYTRWSQGFPWDFAHAGALTRTDLNLNAVTWVVTVAWTVLGLWRLVRAQSSQRPRTPPAISVPLSASHSGTAPDLMMATSAVAAAGVVSTVCLSSSSVTNMKRKVPSVPSAPASQLALTTVTRRVDSLAPGMGRASQDVRSAGSRVGRRGAHVEEDEMADDAELRDMKVDELKKVAKEEGVTGTSGMRKDELVETLSGAGGSDSAGAGPDGGHVRTGDRTSKSVQYSQEVTSPDDEPEREGRSLVTTSHDVIREWAEGRGGKPATVDGTEHGDHLGVLRIVFRDGGDNLREVGWDEWFDTFDQRRLNFIYQEDRTDGNRSTFFRLESPDREDG